MNLRILPALLGLGLVAPSAMAAPIGLSDVMQRAIASSPAVLAAKAAHDLDAAQLAEARSAFLPQLSVTGNALQLEGSPVAVFGIPSSGPQSGFGGAAGMTFAKAGEPMLLASVTVTQPLFAGFRNVNGYKAASLQAEATALDLERARRKAALEALDALATWQQKRTSVQALEATLAKAATRLEWVSARTKAGSATTLDRLQGQVQVTRIRGQLAEAKREATLAEGVLTDRLGDDLSGVDALSLDWAFRPMTEQEAIAQALSERLDLRAQTLLEDASAAQAKAAHAGYLPTVNAFGTTSKLGDAANGTGAILGVQASWIPFDGLRTQAGIAKANALNAKRQADRTALRQAIVQDVKQAHAAWAAAAAQRDLREQELAVAEEAKRLADRVRSEGALTLTAYTDADMDRQQARHDLDSARLALRRSELKLLQALGWSPERLIRQEK